MGTMPKYQSCAPISVKLSRGFVDTDNCNSVL